MRLLAVLTMFLTVAAGCKKPKATSPDVDPPKHVSSGGGLTAPNQNGNLSVSGGSGFGAAQAIRKSGARLANKVQLDQLRLSMFQTWQLDNRVPSIDEVMKEARQNPQVLPLLQDEVVILTGATRGDQIWAYTQYPQQAGEHFVITSHGVENIAPEVLKARLEREKAPIKLSK